MPFNPGSCLGQKRCDLPVQPKVSKNSQKSDSEKTEENTSVKKQNKQKENDDGSGDASVEVDYMPYEEWLAAQGLVKLQNKGENIDVKNMEKDSHSGFQLVKDDSKDGDNHSEVETDSVNKNEDEDDKKL